MCSVRGRRLLAVVRLFPVSIMSLLFIPRHIVLIQPLYTLISHPISIMKRSISKSVIVQLLPNQTLKVPTVGNDAEETNSKSRLSLTAEGIAACETVMYLPSWCLSLRSEL